MLHFVVVIFLHEWEARCLFDLMVNLLLPRPTKFLEHNNDVTISRAPQAQFDKCSWHHYTGTRHVLVRLGPCRRSCAANGDIAEKETRYSISKISITSTENFPSVTHREHAVAILDWQEE